MFEPSPFEARSIVMRHSRIWFGHPFVSLHVEMDDHGIDRTFIDWEGFEWFHLAGARAS